MIKNTLILGTLAASLLGGCDSFSKDKTVYRIETNYNQRYYTESEPKLNKKKGIYEIEDLDGNQYKIKQDSIYKIEKYKHKK